MQTEEQENSVSKGGKSNQGRAKNISKEMK